MRLLHAARKRKYTPSDDVANFAVVSMAWLSIVALLVIILGIVVGAPSTAIVIAGACCATAIVAVAVFIGCEACAFKTRKRGVSDIEIGNFIGGTAGGAIMAVIDVEEGDRDVDDGRELRA